MTTINETAQQSFLRQFVDSGARRTQIENVQDRFLKLLVTQLSNQDPLNPMENAEVTTQMAQISTVTGIEKLNTAMADMSAGFLAAQSVQAGALIGRGVLAEGSRLVLEQGRAAVGGLELDQPADRLTVSIVKPNGELVKTIELGAARAGTMTFSWDGSTDSGETAAAGLYQFQVKAVQQGDPVDVKTLGFGRVQSVTLGAQRLVLDTLGLGPVGLDQVKQILQ
jgi:flagellar basal-body rod modification protein FlgD